MTRTKKRTTRAYVWLTPEEKNAWKNKAASSGMNLNDYIRSCVERRKIPQSLRNSFRSLERYIFQGSYELNRPVKEGS